MMPARVAGAFVALALGFSSLIAGAAEAAWWKPRGSDILDYSVSGAGHH